MLHATLDVHNYDPAELNLSLQLYHATGNNLQLCLELVRVRCWEYWVPNINIVATKICPL